MRLYYKKLGFAAALSVLAVGIWLGLAERLSLSTAALLPDLPELTGQPPALVQHLRQADQAARTNPSSAAAVGALGVAYHADVFYDHAARCYAVAAALDPHHWRWKYYAALLMEDGGSTGSLVEAWRQVVALKPKYALAWFRLGNAALKQQRYDEASEAYSHAIAVDPERPPERASSELGSKTFPVAAYASYGLARVALKRGQLDEASRILEPVAEAHPKFGSVQRLLGRVYQELGFHQKAEQRIARASECASYFPPADPMVDALARESRSSTFLLKQGSLAAKSLNGPWSVYLGRRAVEVNSTDAAAVAELGLRLLALKRPDEALPYLKRYRGMGRDDHKMLSRMGYWLCLNGRLAEGVEYLRDALRIDPKHTDALNNLGLALARMGNPGDGFEYCKEAIRIEPDFAGAYKNLGTISLMRGEVDEAIKHFEEAILRRANDPGALGGLGMALGRKGRLAEARQHLEKALQVRPDDVKALRRLGEVAARQGQVDEAVRHLLEATRVEPTNAPTHFALGRLLGGQGKWAAAAKHLRAALVSNPGDIETIDRLAWMLATCPQAGVRNGPQAVSLATRACRATGNKVARFLDTLAAAYAESGRFDRAVDAIKEAIRLASANGNASVVAALTSRMELYLIERPYREPIQQGKKN